jgi:hypothetical protein
MLFRDFVILLYQGFLADKNYIIKLRDKIKSEDFLTDVEFDPAFEDWKSIDPTNPETHHGNRMKFHPNPYDPQSGVYTYENRKDAREKALVIKECLSRRRKNANYQKPED